MSDPVTYAAGVKHCRTCNKALDEITCPKAQTWFSCGRPECNVLKNMPVPIQFLPEGKLCDADECTNLARRRAYPKHQKLFYCSDECHEITSLLARGAVQANCHHCGTDLGLRVPTKSGFHYCRGHEAAYRHEKSKRELCGRFLDEYKVYEVFAVSHYKHGIPAAGAARRFLGFINTETRIRRINSVNVDHIGQYINQQEQKGTDPQISLVKVFFDYLILQKVYIHRNPVRPGIHYKKGHRNEPRVYSDRELKKQLALLEERGDTATKTIYSMGLEAGPTLSEFCSLQISDVRLDERRLWFRNPDTKPGAALYSHWAPFGDETARWMSKWLDERPKDCGHDYVFLNAYGDPITQWSLSDLMNAVLLRKSKFREHAAGVGEFSLKKLRLTNIWLYHKSDLDDSMNMRIHGIRAVATMKRFNKVMRDDEIDIYTKAVTPDRDGKNLGDEGKKGE